MDHPELADAFLTPQPPALYAVPSRTTKRKDKRWLEAWTQTLEVSRPLPTLPLWLTDDFAVPLELEESYEETCRGLRIR